MLHPAEQWLHTLSAERRSNGRATNRYGIARQRAHRADLDGVPAERRPEVLAGRDRDLLGRAAREQLDEPVAADLVAEPRAPRAQDAALAVEVHQRRQRTRLRVDALGLHVPALARPERERLVLQRALAAPVADRAVERVVQQQELEVRHLRLVRLLGGVLRPHDHARRDRRRARRQQLALALDLDVALPARPDRLQLRVVAEPGISMPTCSAARMMSVPFGTVTSLPSIVSVTSSSAI